MAAGGIGIRPLHRGLGTVLALFLLYLSVTGTIVQLVDLRALLTHAPATSPDMMAIRESIDGSSNYAVLSAPDYAAPAFGRVYDWQGGLSRVLRSARQAGGGQPWRFVELRLAGSKPVGRVMAGDRLMQFDATNGARLEDVAVDHPKGPQPSLHRTAKNWHRLFALGDWMLWLNALAGIGLFAMVVTGLWLYLQLWRGRARLGRRTPFWSAGGWLRTSHRSISLVAAFLLLFVSITGTLLSIDSFALQIYRTAFAHGRFPAGMTADYSSPLAEAALPEMLGVTLAAYRREQAERPIKAVRLRTFAGYPQGVVIAGGTDTAQLVFNASTGRHMSMTEAGYPYTGFPTGWELHELLKRIHRGDAFGLPGRFLDLFAGLSLVFLTSSGLWMYLDLWRRRRRAGRTALFWR